MEKLYRKGIRRFFHEMIGAIETYMHLAKDAYERNDTKELKEHAKYLLAVLGETDVPPEELNDNNESIRESIISLEKIVNSVCEGTTKKYYQQSKTSLPKLKEYLINSSNFLK